MNVPTTLIALILFIVLLDWFTVVGRLISVAGVY